METSRFTRVLFGLAPSLFPLATVIREHLLRYKSVNPKLVEEVERSIYVDDLITGGESVKQALEAKQTARAIYSEATFELHKWQSNVRDLEADSSSQIIVNRAKKIQEKQITWRHVPTQENPADVGSRGGEVRKVTTLWWRGPSWPSDLVTASAQETEAEEVKQLREVFALAVEKTNDANALDELLEKHELWRVLRVGAWVARFLHNSRINRKRRVVEPLTTEEIEKQTTFWMKRAQQQAKSSKQFEEDRLQLNVQENQDRVLECRGRIQGHYPVFLPDSAPYKRKLIHRSHVDTLHGGVVPTMIKGRERYWVPRLRKLAKQVVKACSGCKRFQATPPPGLLPTDRTEGNTPFEVIGVDFAGPLKYRVRSKKEGKAYLALYACSLTRGLFLKVLPNLETSEFLRSLKGLTARR